jgi:hypothetical protein
MNRLLIASALLATLLPATVAARLTTPAQVRQTVARNLSFSLVVAPGTQQVLLIGTIDSKMAASLQQLLAKDPAIHTVMVDLYGGNIESAMDISEVIRQRKLRLIVDGRCLSACANYLFPAAVSKTVLPGSVVAIHGLVTLYREGEQVKLASESQAHDLFRSSSHAADRAAFERRLARQSAFYRGIGLQPDAQATFGRYLAHRKALFGTDMIDATQHALDCPPAQMWTLDQQQWQAMGVKGIESYWYPATSEQRQQLLRDLGMPADYFYYGPGKGLEQLCQPTLGARIRHWFSGRQ